jgi:hypothetical protein
MMTVSDLDAIARSNFDSDREKPPISGTTDTQMIEAIQKALPEDVSRYISGIEILDSSDSRLYSPDRSKHFNCEVDNGKLVIDQAYLPKLRELLDLSEKKTIGFFDRIELSHFQNIASRARIYPLVQFDELIKTKLTSTKDALVATRKNA